MSDQANGLKDDIAYLRTLAVQGRRGPVLGGAFLAAAGFIYGTASLVQWGAMTGRLPLAAASIGTVWIGASGLFALAWLVLFVLMRRGPGMLIGSAQVAFGMTWSAAGIGIVTVLAASLILNARLHDPALLNLNALTAFAFYGTAWFVSAALARKVWMYAIAAIAFGVVLVLAAVLATSSEMLVFGAGLFVTLFLPGAWLMLATPR